MKHLTNDEKDRYLNRLYRKEDYIRIKNEQLERLRACSTSISMDYSTETKTNKISDKIGNEVSCIVDLENELKHELEKYTAMSKEITETINTLPNETERTVLLYRYINFKTWEEIGYILGYGKSQIFRIRRKALKDITINV